MQLNSEISWARVKFKDLWKIRGLILDEVIGFFN
jgi:hypothetical protein